MRKVFTSVAVILQMSLDFQSGQFGHQELGYLGGKNAANQLLHSQTKAVGSFSSTGLRKWSLCCEDVNTIF